VWRLIPLLLFAFAVVARLAIEEPSAPAVPVGYARDVAVGSSSVVVGGDASGRSILVRYRSDGTVEGVTTTPGAQLAAVTPSLALVSVLERGRYRPELIRIGDGSRVASAPVGDGDAFGRALAVGRDGVPVVASDARRGEARVVAVTRARRTTFLSMPGRALTAAGVTVAPDRTIVVAGTAYDHTTGASDAFLARLGPTGPALSAVEPLRSGAQGTVAQGLALDHSGKPVVAASGRVGGRSVFQALRAGGPPTVVRVGPGDAFASDVAVDGAGRVVLVGTASGRGAVVRLSSTGAVESKQLLGRGRLAAGAVDRHGGVVVAGSVLAGAREKPALRRIVP
jgi:hypothetical protein